MRAIITVVGEDRVGIIADVSTLLSAANVNILDISQTIMQGYFTMMMLVDLDVMTLPLVQLQDKLNETGSKLGVVIKLQHEDIFKSMHRV